MSNQLTAKFKVSLIVPHSVNILCHPLAAFNDSECKGGSELNDVSEKL